MLEYWNDGVAPFGQINACGGNNLPGTIGFEQIGACLSSDTHLQGKDIIYSNGRFVLFPIEKNEFDSFFRLFLEAISNFR
jgi:hypothetical protein